MQKAVFAVLPSMRISYTKFILERIPTEDELSNLRKVADRFGCTLSTTIRTNEEYLRQIRRQQARRSGKW